MNRFFVNTESKEISVGDNFSILGEDYKHIKNVLRLKQDDNLELVINEKVESVSKIIDIKKNEVIVEVLEIFNIKRESDYTIRIFQSLPKQSKMETIIQKAVELGVREIIPVNSDRAIVKLKDKDTDKKLLRWNKIALEASKQSKRIVVPEVKDVINLKDIKSIYKDGIDIVAYESENNISLKSIKSKFNNTIYNIYIGPEGGFSESEIEYFKENNMNIITLGNRILRTETAGQHLISILLYELEKNV